MSAENKSSKPKSSPPSMFSSRRQFIQLGMATVGAAWLGTLLQTRLFPDTSSVQEARPVEFPLSELPVGGTKGLIYGGSPVLVLRTTESIRAFTLICTHLGCTVEWRANEKEFYCPCHDGVFDEFGEVLSGPPPVPLEQIPVTVEGEIVIIGEAA